MKDALWPELEKLGEARVRELLLLEVYRGSKRFYVEEWLRAKEFARFPQAVRRSSEERTGGFERSAVLGVFALTAIAVIGHFFVLS